MKRSTTRPDISFPQKTKNGFTRRGFLAGAGSLLLLGAAGCGGSSGDSGEETTSGGGARTIEHKFGQTEISGAPERVVSVGYNDQDAILALGVVPVGMRKWIGDRAVWPWNREALGGEEPEIMPSAELNFEQIATLQPDLIIGIYSGMTAEEYETLSEIAPTIAQSDEYVDYGVPWQEQTRVTGRALGNAERADELVSEVEGRFKRARENNPQFEGASGVFASSFEAGVYGIYSPEDSRGRFLTSLGFEVPEEIEEVTGEEFSAEISGERLDLLDADLLVWIITAEGTVEAIEEDPLYRRLAAFEQGRDIFLEPEDPLQAALSFSTVLSLPFAIEDAVPRFTAAIDGDPETEVERAAETTG